MKKFLKELSIGVLFATLIFYAGGTTISASFDISEWEKEVRQIVGGRWITVCLMIAGIGVMINSPAK